MSPSERIKLNLELDLASQPIEGEVHAAGGSSHPFVGWLGLTSALEQAVADGESSIHPQGETHAP
jgi:hypothetical protein